MTFSSVMSAASHDGLDGVDELDLFLGVDDLDDDGQVLRQADDLGGVEHARVSEAERSAQHGGPGEMHLARFQHDRLVERLVVGLVVLADKDAQQHGVTGKLHRQIHFKELIEAAQHKA